MRAAWLTTFIAAAVLATGTLDRRAEAMTIAARSTLESAAAPLTPIHRVVNVCGRNGCVPVQTKRVHRQKPGSVAAHHI